MAFLYHIILIQARGKTLIKVKIHKKKRREVL